METQPDIKANKRRTYYWKIVLVLCLLGVGILFGARHMLERADRKHFVEKLQVGYDRDIVLLPVYAPVELRLHQALLGDINGTREFNASQLVLRILASDRPERADLERVTGTNWADIVACDEWKNMALGAEAWRKAALLLLERPDRSPAVCAQRLHCWPPAMLRLTRARIYSDGFLDTAIRGIQRDAARTEKFLARRDAPDREKFQAACALYDAAACLHGLKGAERWRRTAEKAVREYLEKHQVPDGTIDADLQATLDAIESIMPPLAVAHRAGLPPPAAELSARIQQLLDFLVFLLDNYGCVPFVAADCDDANRREWLFWGGRIFDRPDFAWAAYGGLDMLEARPPPRIAKAFPNIGLYVMRSSWEIRRFKRLGEQFRVFDPRTKEFRATVREREYHNMSHALWFDAKRGVIELFAFGQRQVQIRLPRQNISACAWQPGKEGEVAIAKAGTTTLAVAQLPEIDAWLVRLWAGDENNALAIEPLRTRLVKAEGQENIVTDPGWPEVGSHTFLHLRMKKFGVLCMKTDGAFCESGDGRFTVMPQTIGGPVTLALAGATGVWEELDDCEISVTPFLAATGGDFSLTTNECVFNFHEHAEGNAEENNRRQKRLTFDQEGVSIETILWEDNKAEVRAVRK